MRQIYSILIFSTLISCSVQKTGDRKSTLEILSATQQKWYGGRPNSGTGMNYEITIVCPSDQLTLDTLYFSDYKSKVGLIKGNQLVQEIIEGDTLTLKVGKILSRDIPKPIKTPVQLEGAALLSYTLNGKAEYIQISEFKKLEDVFYP